MRKLLLLPFCIVALVAICQDSTYIKQPELHPNIVRDTIINGSDTIEQVHIPIHTGDRLEGGEY